jgi:hypothetical protein
MEKQMHSVWLLQNKWMLSGILLLVGALSACKGPDHIVNSTADTSTCAPMVESVPRFNTDEPLRAVEVVRGYQMQNCLVLEVNYTGCGTEEVELVWDGIMMKSIPPRIRVKPQLNKDGICKMLRSETVTFDLENLLQQHGKIVVILPGISEPIQLDIN